MRSLFLYFAVCISAVASGAETADVSIPKSLSKNTRFPTAWT